MIDRSKVENKDKIEIQQAYTLLNRSGRGWKMNNRTRRQALESLGRLGPLAVEHASVVADCLKDADWVLRKTACECLGKMGRGAHAQGPKVAALLNDDTTHVRKAAIEALAQLGEESDNKFNAIVGRLVGLTLTLTLLTLLNHDFTHCQSNLP